MKKKGIKIFTLGMSCVLGLSMLTGCSESKETNGVAKTENNVLIENAYVIVGKDNKYGLVDKDGKQMIEKKYSTINYYPATKQFVVQKDKLYGVVNENDEVIIPLKYDNLYYSLYTNLYYASEANKTILLNDKGEEEKTYNYGLVYEINKDYSTVGLDIIQNEYTLIPQKYGLIDKDGKEIIAPNYDNLICISEYDAEKKQYVGELLFYAEKDGKAGVLNLKGDVVIPMDYNSAESLDEYMKNYFIVYSQYTQTFLVNKDGKYGVLKQDGSTLIDIKYDVIYGDHNGYSAVLNNETTFYDADGKEIIKVNGTQYSPFAKNGIVSVREDYTSNAKYIDKEGNTKDFKVLENKDASPSGFDDNGIASISLEIDGENAVALMNDKGEFVIDPIKGDNYAAGFTNISEKRSNIEWYYPRIFKADGKLKENYYVLDKTETTETTTGTFTNITGSILYDDKGNKLGECDGWITYAETNDLLHIQRSEISFSENIKNFGGLINTKGVVIVEPIYDLVSVYDDFIIAVKGDTTFLLDKESGKVVYEFN